MFWIPCVISHLSWSDINMACVSQGMHASISSRAHLHVLKVIMADQFSKGLFETAFNRTKTAEIRSVRKDAIFLLTRGGKSQKRQAMILHRKGISCKSLATSHRGHFVNSLIFWNETLGSTGKLANKERTWNFRRQFNSWLARACLV